MNGGCKGGVMSIGWGCGGRGRRPPQGRGKAPAPPSLLQTVERARRRLTCRRAERPETALAGGLELLMCSYVTSSREVSAEVPLVYPSLASILPTEKGLIAGLHSPGNIHDLFTENAHEPKLCHRVIPFTANVIENGRRRPAHFTLKTGQPGQLLFFNGMKKLTVCFHHEAKRDFPALVDHRLRLYPVLHAVRTSPPRTVNL